MIAQFQFETAGKCFFGTVYRPVAQVSFKSYKNDIWTDAWLIIDTGADFTILPRYLSQELQISLEEDCIKAATSGVGGEQTIYLCKTKVTVKIGKIERKIPLAFFDSNEVPALLGRLGFLETFNTEFLKTHMVILKD